MVKYLNKKEINTEESPIMLQRRHTVMEVDKDYNLKEPKLKSITRSSSTNSMNKDTKENFKNKQGDTISPHGSDLASNASTVVITDSELSSSWLYNNIKAQIKTSPVANNFTSSSRSAEMNDEMRSPMLPKSKIRSASMIGGQSKKSSCCCYTMIVLIIAVASLGILAAIASILYLEFFASYNATDIQLTTLNPTSLASVPLKKFGHSFGKENQKIKDLSNVSERTSETILFPDSSTKVSKKIIVNENETFEIDNEKENRETLLKKDSSSVIIDDLLNLTSQVINSVTKDRKGNLNPINALFSRNQNLRSHYSKLFELYQSLRSSNSSEEKESNKAMSQTTEESDTNNLVNDLNSMQLSIIENKNSVENDSLNDKNLSVEDEIPPELAQDLSIFDEEVSMDTSATAKNGTKSLSHTDVTVGDSSEISKDSNHLVDGSNKERDLTKAESKSSSLHKIEHDPPHFKLNDIIGEERIDDFLNLPLTNTSENLELTPKLEKNVETDVINTDIDGFENVETFPNKLEQPDNLEAFNLFRTLNVDFEDNVHDDQSKVPDSEQPLSNLPIVGTTNRSIFIPNFLSRLGLPNFLRIPDDNSADKEQISIDNTDSVDLNLPIVDTNIAVPRPIEINRRFGLMKNEENNQVDLTKQDTQFSLSKALDRLRLLDANNNLPASRQSKTAFQKKKEEPNFPSNQEVATERSRYLENLRMKLFE